MPATHPGAARPAPRGRRVTHPEAVVGRVPRVLNGEGGINSLKISLLCQLTDTKIK